MTRERPDSPNGKPPIFSTWTQLYLFVLICHALIILLFFWLTKMYS